LDSVLSVNIKQGIRKLSGNKAYIFYESFNDEGKRLNGLKVCATRSVGKSERKSAQMTQQNNTLQRSWV